MLAVRHYLPKKDLQRHSIILILSLILSLILNGLVRLSLENGPKIECVVFLE